MKKIAILLIILTNTSCDPIKRIRVNSVERYTMTNLCGKINFQGGIFGRCILYLNLTIEGDNYVVLLSKIKEAVSINTSNPIYRIEFVDEKENVIEGSEIQVKRDKIYTVKVDFRDALKENQIITILPNNYIQCGGKQIIS